MHNLAKLTILGAFIASPISVMAQTAATPVVAVKLGKMLSSSDGRRLGRIDQLDKAKDGTLETAELFSDQGVLYIPVSTITAPTSSTLVTSLTYSDAMKGK